jgi:hypothetical protein
VWPTPTIATLPLMSVSMVVSIRSICFVCSVSR